MNAGAKAIVGNDLLTLIVRAVIVSVCGTILTMVIKMNADIARNGVAITAVQQRLVDLEINARDYEKYPIFDANKARDMERHIESHVDEEIKRLEDLIERERLRHEEGKPHR